MISGSSGISWFAAWVVMLIFYIMALTSSIQHDKEIKILKKEQVNVVSLKEEAVSRGFARYEVSGGTNVVFVWNDGTNTCIE